MARSFYSLIQYCPDAFRAEIVNVGLVILQPVPYAICVRITDNYDRVKKLFEIEEINLKISLDNMKYRIENSTDEIRTEEDLANFAASRANSLKLTKPRLAVLDDFNSDFERLFKQLVL